MISMAAIELRPPTLADSMAAQDYIQEFFDNGELEVNGSALLDKMPFDEWLENTKRNADVRTVRSDWVLSETFFAVRQSDKRIVGMLDMRLSLNNDFLREYGGNIGYSVRPSERRKGYAVQMLSIAITRARALGMSKLMLGCYCDNSASIKTIEHCGGVLGETKPYVNGKPMHVYWITL